MQTTFGDASLPMGSGPRIIAHIVNDQGKWGAGFTYSLSRNWPEAERDYRLWHRYRTNITLDRTKGFHLGNVRYTLVQGGTADTANPEEPLWVAHMCAQEGLIGGVNRRPLRYDALGACLMDVAVFADLVKASVHMPKIGSGLAGGDWDIIKEMLYDAFDRNSIKYVVYELPPQLA